MALGELQKLAAAGEPWAVPWPCVYECLRVVSHSGIYQPTLPAAEAWRRLQHVLAGPDAHLLPETPRHAELLAEVLAQSGASGNRVHDAHIWTLCLEHGVTELVSGDRDFGRFRGLKLRNPFAGL